MVSRKTKKTLLIAVALLLLCTIGYGMYALQLTNNINIQKTKKMLQLKEDRSIFNQYSN